MKVAYYYKRKGMSDYVVCNVCILIALSSYINNHTISYLIILGFSTAVIGADTFRAGATDQLRQNALKEKIPD